LTKTALITGITGQDGSYLAELLLSKDYVVHGIVRRSSLFNTDRIDHLYQDPHHPGTRLFLHYGDLGDATSLLRVVEEVQPDEVYNLAAQSHVKVSFIQPVYTADIAATGTLRLLEALREYGARSGKRIRIYQAGSSEMFGASPPPQHERTPFHPRSPYGVSKLAAHWYSTNYREAYEMFICNGILFNHESPRRGETFVSRKITRAATRIKLGLQDRLYLGNLDSYRDWTYAADAVQAMWLMLQRDRADDYVIASGQAHSIRQFLDLAFGTLEMNWSDYVDVDPRYLRPAEVDHLRGDATKARRELGWAPTVNFKQLVEMMIEHDMRLAKSEETLRDAGHDIPRKGTFGDG